MIIYITNPFFIWVLHKIPEHILNIIFISSVSIFVIDWFISLFVISRMKSTVKQVRREETYDNTEEITKRVKEILLGKTILDRRLVHAFPRISIEKVKQHIKETTDYVRESTIKVKEEVAEHMKESAAKVRQSAIKVKEETTERAKMKINNKKKK